MIKKGLKDTFQIRVTTKSSHKDIKIELREDGSKFFRVYITEAPENGKANSAVLKLLAKYLKIAPSYLRIIHGLKSRDKTVIVERDI